MPWDPWLPKCSKNLARSCQDSQDASKRVNPGSEEASTEVKKCKKSLMLALILEILQKVVILEKKYNGLAEQTKWDR